MFKKLIDIKTGKELKRLPHIKPRYPKLEIPLGRDCIKKFFNARERFSIKIGVDEIERLGFYVVEDRIDRLIRDGHPLMYRNQEFYYFLKHKDEGQLKGHQNYCKESDVPKHIRIIFKPDKGISGAVRLEGKGTGWRPEYAGAWRDIETGEKI